MSSIGNIAYPYAQSWFECAQSQDSLELYLSAIDFLASCVQNSQVDLFLKNPTLQSTDRLELMKKLWQQALVENNSHQKINQQVDSFLQLLSDNDRLLVLPEIQKQLVALQSKSQGKTSVAVKTAFTISEDVKSLVSNKIAAYYKDVDDVTYAVDDSVLGGLEAQDTNSRVIDISTAGQLKKLSQSMGIKNYQLLNERG